jgi:uncharacterized protein with von Willebrand factor type A (vWA) domain
MADHVTAFSHALHQAGVSVDPGRLIDYFKSLELTGLDDRQSFYNTARAVLVSCYEDIPVFDQVFEAYWSGHHLSALQPNSDTVLEQQEGAPDVGEDTTVVDDMSSAEDGDDEGEAQDSETRGYSADEVLMQRNLATLSEEELDQAMRIVQQIVELIASYRSRRRVSDRRGREIDFRRMLRRNMLKGRDAVELCYRSKRIKKTRLILLCDISGSMQAYSRFTIQFMCALRHLLPQLEVAVFSTRMTVITDLLDRVGVAESLRRVSEAVPDWSGGTDIGKCIREFNDFYDRDIAHSKTVAIILSDGWDLGEAALMRQELQHLHRNVHKLLWLNPLLGDDDYQPICQGMRTAMPYIDYFLPAHNLESLANLAHVLRSM